MKSVGAVQSASVLSYFVQIVSVKIVFFLVNLVGLQTSTDTMKSMNAVVCLPDAIRCERGREDRAPPLWLARVVRDLGWQWDVDVSTAIFLTMITTWLCGSKCRQFPRLL